MSVPRVSFREFLGATEHSERQCRGARARLIETIRFEGEQSEDFLDGLGASAAVRGAADGRVDLTHAPGGICHGSLDVNLAECVAGTDDHGFLLVAGHRQPYERSTGHVGAIMATAVGHCELRQIVCQTQHCVPRRRRSASGSARRMRPLMKIKTMWEQRGEAAVFYRRPAAPGVDHSTTSVGFRVTGRETL